MKETDLFQPVKEFFEAEGYTVYSEVECGPGRADIVAVNGSVLAVVELKTTLSLELYLQALRWKGFANYVYIAVPRPKKGHGREVDDILQHEGIGMFTVRELERGRPRADLELYPSAKFMRRISPALMNALREEHRTWAPGGTNSGGYVTDYKLMMQRVKNFLQGVHNWDGWAPLSLILDHCETHYANPKQSLAKALLTIEAGWCETKKENGRLYFRYKPGAHQREG